VLRGVGWFVAVATLLAACTEALDPLERDAGEAGITIEVTGCDLDEGTGLVMATAEVTSKEKEYSTVLVDFELVDSEGVVVASTSTSAANVKPGQTYRLQMPLSPAGELGSGFECRADLNLATEQFG
jgi:hypothetical protein